MKLPQLFESDLEAILGFVIVILICCIVAIKNGWHA